MTWKTVKLGDILNFRRGHDLPHSEMREGDIPVAGSNGCIGYHDVATPIAPIITVGRSGNIGTPYYYEKAWAHNTTLYVDDFKGNNPKYLYYLLKTLPLASFTGGSAVPTLNRNHIHPLEVLHTEDKKTQDKIVATLSSIDDKIENNNRIIANLEAQAQALFKSRFVDFEPWGGKMPNDWREYQLTEFADIIGGYSYKGAELMPSEDAMATIKNFDRKGYFKLDGYKEIHISGRLKNTQILHLLDVVVAHTDITQQADIIGNPAIILSKGGYRNIIMSMDLCKVQPTHYAISSAFLYCLLKDNRFKSHALGYVNGTTVLHMSKKALPDYTIFLPSNLSEVQDFGEQLQSLYKQCALNIEENQRLATLRDTLLPKLMKGELL